MKRDWFRWLQRGRCREGHRWVVSQKELPRLGDFRRISVNAHCLGCSMRLARRAALSTAAIDASGLDLIAELEARMFRELCADMAHHSPVCWTREDER